MFLSTLFQTKRCKFFTKIEQCKDTCTKPRLAYRSSMNAYREQDWMMNMPLYGVNVL